MRIRARPRSQRFPPDQWRAARLRRAARQRCEARELREARAAIAKTAAPYLGAIYSTCALPPSVSNRQFERAVADGVFEMGKLVLQVKIETRFDATQAQVYQFPGFFALVRFSLGSFYDRVSDEESDEEHAEESDEEHSEESDEERPEGSGQERPESDEEHSGESEEENSEEHSEESDEEHSAESGPKEPKCQCANCERRAAVYARAKASAREAVDAEYARLGAVRTPGGRCSLHPPPVAIPISETVGCFDCGRTGRGPEGQPCRTCKGVVVPAHTSYGVPVCGVCDAAIAAGHAASDSVFEAAAGRLKVPAGTRPIELVDGVSVYPVGLSIGFDPEPLEVCTRLCPMHPATRQRIVFAAKRAFVSASLDDIVAELSREAPLCVCL